MLPITQHLHFYLSSVRHLDRRVDRQHGTDILQRGAVSLQTLERQTATQQRLHVLGLPVIVSSHTHIVLKHARRIGNHGLVVSQLLVARGSVVVAGAQNLVHRGVRSDTVDCLRVLVVTTEIKAYLVDSFGELAGLEELVSRRLVSLQRRELVDLLFSLDLRLDMRTHPSANLRLRNLQKTEEVGIVRVVGETLVQNVLGLHELSLHVSPLSNSDKVDHCVRSTMVTLQEGLITLNASKTICLRFTPLS